MREQAIRLDPAALHSDLPCHLTMLHEVRRHARRFRRDPFPVDLLHFPLFADIATRTLTTCTADSTCKDLPAAYRRWPRFPLVSISDHQRRPLRMRNWAGDGAHGMPPSLYRASPTASGSYLAFLGRISPEKRPDRAIAIAQRAGMPLQASRPRSTRRPCLFPRDRAAARLIR